MKHPLILLSLATGALLNTAAVGQEAQLQVIHNSPDLAASVVDVYVNGDLFFDDFAFRTARGFNAVPADVELSVAIAPGNSTSVDDALYTEAFTLDADESYIMVASGIVSPTGYMPAQPFSLEVFPSARLAAAAGSTDVLVMHGSTDAPTVDVYESGVLMTTAVDDISYPEFQGYLSLPTNDYTLEVRTADGVTTVAAYSAPLATLGLDGAAITVLASGFLDPSMNSNGPAFGLWVATAAGGELIPLPLAGAMDMAQLQVIHNSPDLAASVVDVYVNGDLFFDDFAFRTARGFNAVPAGVELSVAIAPGNSTSVDDALYTEAFTLAADESYIMVASGIVSPTGYMPAQPFSLEVFPTARLAAVGAGTDVLVMHGSTDAPTVDVYESGVLMTTAVDDISYPEFQGYLSLPTDDYTLEVRTADGVTTVAAYSAPLATLSLDGSAITVLASGFLDPSMNSNGPAFGLWVATAAGGPLVELPSVMLPTGTALVQVIHNCPDAAASMVDIYINEELAIEDLEFRNATAELALPSGVELNIGVAGGDSNGPEDIIATFPVTLDADENYRVIANGILSATGYSPAPAFNLDIFAGARSAAQVSTNTDVLVYHGSTDAPTVDVAETSVPAGVIVDDISYTEFQGYLPLATADYELEVRTTDGTPVVRYDAPLAGLGLDGASITLLASGFLNTAMNSNGPEFGLWAALATGGPLVPLPISVGLDEEQALISASVHPNPTNGQLFIELDSRRELPVAGIVTDMSGRTVANLSAQDLATGTNRLQMDLSALANGMYTLSLLSNTEVRSIPLQIAR